MKENRRTQSGCYQQENQFDYHGIEKALCGKEPNTFGRFMHFIPKRIRVIQMN